MLTGVAVLPFKPSVEIEGPSRIAVVPSLKGDELSSDTRLVTESNGVN